MTVVPESKLGRQGNHEGKKLLASSRPWSSPGAFLSPSPSDDLQKTVDTPLDAKFLPSAVRSSHQEGEQRDHPELPPPTGMCWSNAVRSLFLCEMLEFRRQTSPSCLSQEHPSPRLSYSLAHWRPGGRCIQACPGASWKRVLMGDEESCPRPQRSDLLRFLPKSL